MRRWLWLTIGILLTFSLSTVSAQASSPNVFFGIRSDNALISYTLDGTVNVLLENLNPERIRLLKTESPEHPLLVAEVDGQLGLWLVDPTQPAKPIALPNELTLSDNGWISGAAHAPYYVLQVVGNPGESVGILVNTDTLEAKLLSGIVFHIYILHKQTVFFSKDGTKLRYVSKDENVQDVWNLLERDIPSGDERKVYTINGDIPYVSSDSTGDHWISRKIDEDTKVVTTTLINTDGTTTDIAQDKSFWMIWNDQLYHAFNQCHSNCPIEITSLDRDANKTMNFTASKVAYLLNPLAIPDKDHLLIHDSPDYWLLKNDGSAIYLGLYNPSIYSSQVLSDDERWFLVVTRNNEGKFGGYAVWDLQAQKTVLEGPLPDDGIYIVYADSGIILWEYPDHQRVYRFSDGKTFELKQSKDEALFDLVNPQISLVRVKPDSQVGKAGIYSYNLDIQEYKLLAANTRNLVATSVWSSGE